jgi:hypothetical protein
MAVSIFGRSNEFELPYGRTSSWRQVSLIQSLKSPQHLADVLTVVCDAVAGCVPLAQPEDHSGWVHSAAVAHGCRQVDRAQERWTHGLGLEVEENGSRATTRAAFCAFAHRLDVDHAIEKLGGHW